MLEYFDSLWSVSPRAAEEEIARLQAQLTAAGFPSVWLPAAYLDLLRESNGGDFAKGAREYQFFSAEEVLENYEAYQFARYMPFAFPFAMDGRGHFYVFDLRARDESVYLVHASDLGWQDEARRIADDLNACLRQEEAL